MIKENTDNMATSKFFHEKFKPQTGGSPCKIYNLTKRQNPQLIRKGETTLKYGRKA